MNESVSKMTFSHDLVVVPDKYGISCLSLINTYSCYIATGVNSDYIYSISY